MAGGKFTLDAAGEVPAPNPIEIRYRSGRGDAWYESDHFYWFGEFDKPIDVSFDAFLIRPHLANQNTVHKERWPAAWRDDGARAIIRVGPISFMPIAWGRHVVEIRVHGGQTQSQRVDIIRCD